MLENVWTAFSVGRGVIRTLGLLKKDIDSFRSDNAQARSQFAQLEVLDKRTGTLESIAKQQESRLREIERSLQDALNATEALAERAGMIFWIAVTGCGLSVTALVFSAVALALHK